MIFTPIPETKKVVRRARTKKPTVPANGPRDPALMVPSRKPLCEFRVIQRNLVYVIGISARIAHENILKEAEYFGQYGRIVKIVVNRRNLAAMGTTQTVGNGGATSCTTAGPSASAYITFVRKEDAARAIGGVDGSVFDGRVLRATYGTTKYCSFFLRGMACTNTGCMYLHEEGEHVDSFTKDELTAGKMHMHSYILEKAEAAGMKQFGVLPAKGPAAAAPQPARPAGPLPAPVSKPSTPTPPPMQPVFLDRTPSSFFERISKLAAQEDPFVHAAEAAGESPPGLATSPVLLPPGVQRRHALLRFDPFQPAEELLVAVGSGSTRPPVPPPIGSPVSRSPALPVRFSESLGSAADGAAPPKVEPSVENFFHLFSNGALTTNQPASASSAVAGAGQSAPHPRTVEASLFALDPAGKSIFEDPAIMQARLAQKTRAVPVVLPMSAPASPTRHVAAAVASTSFTTVKTKTLPAAVPAMQPQPSSKKAKPAKPLLVIQEPVFTDQNAFAALLSSASAVPKKAAPPKPLHTQKPPADPSVLAAARRYERPGPLPAHMPTDPDLLQADVQQMDLEQVSAFVTRLEAATRINYDQVRHIEVCMKDIRRKSTPATK